VCARVEPAGGQERWTNTFALNAGGATSETRSWLLWAYRAGAWQNRWLGRSAEEGEKEETRFAPSVAHTSHRRSHVLSLQTMSPAGQEDRQIDGARADRAIETRGERDRARERERERSITAAFTHSLTCSPLHCIPSLLLLLSLTALIMSFSRFALRASKRCSSMVRPSGTYQDRIQSFTDRVVLSTLIRDLINIKTA